MNTDVASAVRVRDAELSDLDLAMALVLKFQFSAYANFLKPNPSWLRHMTEHLLAGHSLTFFVAEDAGEVLGMMGALVYHHPASGELVGHGIVGVDVDDHRAALPLMRAAEAWVQMRGAPVFHISGFSDTDHALFESLGFQSVERIYQRRLQ